MRALKNLLRTPLKSGVLFVLIAGTAYFFISSTMEFSNYTVNATEMLQHYNVTGSLHWAEPFGGHPALEPITVDTSSLISKSKYVETSDMRINAPVVAMNPEYTGISLDSQINDLLNKIYIEGRVLENSIIDPIQKNVITPFKIEITKVLAAKEEYAKVGDVISLFPPHSSVYNGGKYIIPSLYSVDGGIVKSPTVYAVEEGKTYYMEVVHTEKQDLTSYRIGGFICPIDGATKNYLELPALSYTTDSRRPLTYSASNNIAMYYDHIHGFEGLFLKDMSLLPCVASKDIFLVQGRGITPQDGENICVIPMRLSLKYSLAPGDVIDFKIKSNGYGQYFGDDKYHGIRESQAPNDAWEGETTAFKIVGIYDFQDMLSEKIENPTQNTIIFPTAVYQKLADTKAATPQPITESINFTFKLKSAMDIEAFIVETDNALKGSSFKVVLDDMGFSKISEQIKSAKQATLLSLILSTAAFAVTAVLIVYIHILRKSREYAIMRALGTTKAKSAQAVILPVLLMCAPAIILAGIMAAVTGANSMSKLSTDMLPLGFVANTETNLPLLALLMLFVVLIVLILLSIGIYNVSRRSPLALLQNKK